MRHEMRDEGREGEKSEGREKSGLIMQRMQGKEEERESVSERSRES